jgi:uncharacterized protein (TIGR02594 family)
MDELIKIAVSQLGEKEISGAPDNPTIVKYAKDSGFEWVNDDETPWCSIFINWCAMKADLKRSKKANARSWLLVGNATSNPEPGDIVVFWRGSIDSWQGHVGIFLGFSKDQSRVYCLGGNQGNQVSISAYPTSTVLGYRRLKSASQIFDLPDPVLKKGDKGTKVKSLQDALKMAGFDCGTSDGDFVGKTEVALKSLQSTNSDLGVDGVYGANTKAYLLEILQE